MPVFAFVGNDELRKQEALEAEAKAARVHWPAVSYAIGRSRSGKD